MEMCECKCDEVLEPMHYKQSCAYVSVPQMITNEAGERSGMVEQIASAVGPVCPTANCSSLMKIQRYLSSPPPVLVCVGLVWESVEAQASTIKSVLNNIQQSIDIHKAFHGVTQPMTASLQAIICTFESRFCCFFCLANKGWRLFDDTKHETVCKKSIRTCL